MSENNSKKPLKSEAHGPLSAAEDLIDVSYASLSSDDGFQDIMNRWDSYVDVLYDETKSQGLLARIGQHLSRARTLFTQLGPPHSVDPIASEIRRSDAPCAALSTGNLVIEANLSAQADWGVRPGEATDLSWMSADSTARIKTLRQDITLGTTPQPQILRTFDNSQDANINPSETLAEAYPIDDESHSEKPIIIRGLRQSWSDDTEAALKQSFGLTPGEIEVAKAFSQSGNTEQVAAQRETTAATIRKQLKAIFAKTGVSNQAQLQKFLSLMSSSQRKTNRGQLADWRDPLGREQIITDNQGSKIAYSFMGADGGIPVLLSHGTITGYVLHPRAQAMLKDAGITLYVPCRAGFGHTDPFEDLSALDAAQHINEVLLSHLGLRAIPAVGLISGLVPLVYQAARNPSLFSRLLVIGGCVPIYKKERLDELPVNTRVLMALQKNAPHAARLAVQAGFRQVLAHGPSYMVRKIYGNCETDITTLRNLSTLSLMVASSKMLTVHGYSTFERELPLINYDWEDDFARSQIPLTVLQGLEDPVFPPKHARIMEQTHPNYFITEVEGAGQLVFLQKPEAVAQAIIDLVSVPPSKS